VKALCTLTCSGLVMRIRVMYCTDVSILSFPNSTGQRLPYI
jgi:hypothetical protein